jgi:hypothetical protein
MDIVHQKLINPLDMTSGIFYEPDPKSQGAFRTAQPTFMPGSTPAGANRHWPREENNNTSSSTIKPWSKGGLIALHAGSPTEDNKPNPVATAILIEVIEKSIATARSGNTVMVMAEVHPTKNRKTGINFAPNKNGSLKKVTVKTILTIPAGRLVNYRGSEEWTRSGNRIDSNQNRKNRERHSNKTNRYPIHVVLYTPKGQPGANAVTTNNLRILALIMTNYSSPKPTHKTEKHIQWHHPNHNTKTAITITNFPPPPGGWNIKYCEKGDGCLAEAETTKFFSKDPEKPDWRASLINARLTAGLTTDRANIYDRVTGVQASLLCDAAGSPIGSLHTLRTNQRRMGTCTCCGTTTSGGMEIPTTAPTDTLQTLADKLRTKKYTNILASHFNAWQYRPHDLPPWKSVQTEMNRKKAKAPNKKPAPETQPHPDAALTRARSDPGPTKATKDTTDITQNTMPAGAIGALRTRIRDGPVFACLRCSLPYILEEKRNNNPDWRERPDDHATWDEICQTLRGTPSHRLTATNKRWTQQKSPLHQRQHGNLANQAIVIPPNRPGLPTRTGTIVLVAKATKKDKHPSVFARLDDLKLPTTQMPCKICKNIVGNFVACDECNTYYHTKCAKNFKSEPDSKWYCPECALQPRTNTNIKMTLREAHTRKNQFADLARKQNRAKHAAHKEALAKIESNYPTEDPLIELPSPAKKILVIPRKHIFDGPWQTDMQHKTPPTIDTWSTHPTSPTKINSTKDLSYELHWARSSLQHTLLSGNQQLLDQDTPLRLRAMRWEAAFRKRDAPSTEETIEPPETPDLPYHTQGQQGSTYPGTNTANTNTQTPAQQPKQYTPTTTATTTPPATTATASTTTSGNNDK